MEKRLLAYVECALWSSTNISENGDMDEPLDENYDESDIDPESLAKMKADLDAFFEANEEILSDYNETQVAHDFWLTRNGHGCGFWDGSRGYSDEHGEALTKSAESFGSCDLYVGDDNQVHVY